MNGHPPAGSAPAAPPVANGQQQQQPPVRRPRPKKDSGPLRAPRRPLKSITRPLVSLTTMNETKKPVPGNSAGPDSRQEIDALKQEYRNQNAHVFPLVVTRRDLKELRHHVMRLQSKGRVDVQDKEQFTPPIRLHRRDPRAPPSGAGSHFEEEETKEDLEEIKERERIELQKEDRRKIREENQAKIAPTGKTKTQAFQKKTEQKYRPDDTPEAKKRQLLRYEETLPWHLEDFDNKQTWVGQYESELSEAHVMLTTDPSKPHNAIYMAPMERWYRFNVKGKIRPTGDDLEKVMYKVENVPGFLRNIEARAVRNQLEQEQSRSRFGLSTRVGGGDDDEGRIRRARNNDGGGGFIKREADADDIDFNLDEDFADDEEGLNGLFEGEAEEVKEAEEKLKRDQLNASLWERPDEAELARQEERERKAEEEAKRNEKSLKKNLVKREKNFDYIQSDEENPYLTASESDTDSETERLRAKEEEEKKALEANGKAPDGGIPSGASSKGTNTPSGNHASVDIKGKKRPGSPNLSEASGNESSRKKHKKSREKFADGSRQSSLANRRGPGSGSDSEMTDAGKLKKSKKHKSRLVIGTSPSGSPGASRAGSPAASSQLNGSRAASPNASPNPGIPSAKEIYDSLPSQGMNIQTLIVKFKGRVAKTETPRFIRLVKAVSSFDKANSWLTPLPQMPSDETINNFMNAAKSKPAS
jgi:transcription initiation factor TFIIF subunit alpha